MQRSKIRGATTVAVCLGVSFPALTHAQAIDTGLALEEVIVTAQKRETDLQKTPAAVNVVSGEVLQNASVTEIQDLQMLVPNVAVRRTGGALEYSIRGVSAQITTSSDQPSTAVVTDGIYTQSSIAGLGSFVDIARVEVMKGPQGTLFGRNATAGVLSITSKNPEFTTTGRVDADIGNYSRINLAGVFNTPITDNLAVRITLSKSAHDGYFDDGYDDEDVYSGRVKLLFKPNEDFSWLVSGNYARQEGRGVGYVLLNKFTGQTYATDSRAGPTDAAYQAVLPAFRGYWGNAGRFNQEAYGGSTEMNWSVGPGKLTVLGAHQISNRDDVQQNFQFIWSPGKEDSWEVRYASTNADARLQWLGGLYYYRQDVTIDAYAAISGINAGFTPPFGTSARDGQLNLAAFPSVVNSAGVNQTTQDYAFFTQETFAVTQGIRLTAGARYQDETISRHRVQTLRYTNGALTSVSSSPAVSADWQAWTWKAGLDFDIGPDSLGYATVSTGWKAGKPNTYAAPYDEQAPEKMQAYAMGIKNRFFGSRLQLNGELFYWDYRDRQVNITKNPVYSLDGIPATAPNGDPNVSVPLNAPKSHVQGAELDTAYLLTKADEISLNVEYLDEAQFDDLGGQVIDSCPASKDCRANDAPEWSGTVRFRHTQDLGSAGQLVFDYSGKYQTKSLLDVNGVAGEEASYWQEAYYLDNVGLSYAPQNNRWSIRAYVNNLSDELVKASALRESAGFGPAAVTYYRATFLPPRTYGVQFRGEF